MLSSLLSIKCETPYNIIIILYIINDVKLNWYLLSVTSVGNTALSVTA